MSLGRSFAGIEVHGYALTVLVGCFEVFPSVARSYSLKHGVAREDERGRLVVVGDWIPLDAWLAMADAISKEVGPRALLKGGSQFLKHPNLPPLIRDIEGALRSIDVAFHTSHRKNGRLMYDRATGEMQEGIGHFTVRGKSERRRLVVTSDTPYPCALDFGYVTAIAKYFEARSMVVHEEGPGCRTDGAAACSYEVTW